MREQNINWSGLESSVKAAINRVAARMGIKMVEFYKMRFRDQAWKDVEYHPWQKRKKTRRRNSARAVLRKSGRLARSIRVTDLGYNHVTVGTDVPYAQAHNDGSDATVNVSGHTRRRLRRTVAYGIDTRKRTPITSVLGGFYVKPHSRKMNLPKRQFIGYSEYLNEQLQRIIYTEIKRSLNQ